MAINFVRHHYPFYQEFDWYHLSYQHGAMKPETKFYEVVEATAGVAVSELIYIDDRPENVAEGTARGWKAILHETPKKTIHQLQAAGVDF